MNAGDFNTTETVDLPFNTFTSNDPSQSATITNLVAGDIHIHKNGGTTQRSSSAGVTISINFDGITGNHVAHIDLSDNTDAGFYSDGSRYLARIEGTTVDGGTINAWIGGWSVGCTLRPTTAGRTLDIQSTGEVDANLTMMGGVVQSGTDLKDFADAGYDPGTNKVQGVVLVDTTTTNTDMVGTNSAATEAKQDIIDAIVDDLKLAQILVDTTIESANRNTTNCQMATGPVEDNALIGCKVVLVGDAGTGYVARTITDYAASNNVVTWTPAIAQDPVDGGQIYVIPGDTKINVTADAILVDSNELQADWTNGGRLDLILDIIAADTTTDIPALIAALNDLSAAEVNTECDTALTDYDPPTKAEMDTAHDLLATEAKQDTIDGIVDNILVDTNELQTDWTNGGRLDLILDATLAMLDDARTEPGQGAPPVNPDAMTKLDYLYKAWRNKKEQTATEFALYNDAGAVKDQKATVSDDATTATVGEIGTGA